MHILFVHQNFPAQFGHIARHLIRTRGWTCTFVSKTPAGEVDGIRKIEYTTSGRGAGDDALLQPDVRERDLACPRRLRGVQGAARPAARPDRRPQRVRVDAVPARALSRRPDRQLLRVSIIIRTSRTWTSAPSSRRTELDFLRARARNAMLLLDLENCRRGYSPTRFQRELFPEVYRPKIDVIFDGIETEIFRRRQGVPAGSATGSIRPIDADRDLRQPRVRVDARVRHLHESRPARSISSIPTSSSSSWAATGSATAATRSTSGTRRSAST